MKKIRCLEMFAFLLALAQPALAGQGEPRSVDGVLIRQGNQDYRVVSMPESRQIKVYVSKREAPLPSTMVLSIKKKDRILEKLRLSLDLSDPERAHYTGLIGANILISGGVTFEIEW